ncbi:hypothetical protein Nepgr_024122 [Nepenthes gracilis]|uniref:Uncharacterized protein n=1 Tax=Nepenthes gracilis TaxID=150966 RepID=A0AAD3T4E9_NEPGR|nr:hypothetical protein Nepgr_024122 [Nepenthes gracilis]
MFRGGGEEEEVKHGCNEVAVACRLAWGEGVGASKGVGESRPAGEVTCRPGEVADICVVEKVVEGGKRGGAASRDDGGGTASRDDDGGAAPRDDGGGARPYHVVVGSTGAHCAVDSHGKPVEDVKVVGNCSWLPLDQAS